MVAHREPGDGVDRVRDLLARLNRWVGRHLWLRVARRAIVRFLEHDDLQFAGSMAYFAILSLFQLLALGVVVLSLFAERGAVRELVADLVAQSSPIDREAASTIIESINQSRSGLAIFGVASLLWGALGLFSAVNKGINMAWSGPGGPPPSFLRDKLLGLLLIVLTALLALGSVVLSIVIGVVRHLAGDGGGVLFGLATVLLPFLVAFAALVMLYPLVPTPPVRFALVWPGALVGAILWEALRFGFTFYATRVARYETAFGPISTGVTLIVFLYFASVVLLLGAQVAEAYSVESGKMARPAPAPVEVGPSVPIDPDRAPPRRPSRSDASTGADS